MKSTSVIAIAAGTLIGPMAFVALVRLLCAAVALRLGEEGASMAVFAAILLGGAFGAFVGYMLGEAQP